MAEAGWQLSNPLFFLTKEIELMCKAAEDKARGGRPEFYRAGGKPGLQIWRIEMARAKPWDPHKYGKFHRGDSYMVLNTYPGKNGVKLFYDLHFWIGAESSEDEYGTAAFKTAGLDTILWKANRRGNTHREVMEFESELFLSYFKELGGIEYLEGGIEGLQEKPEVEAEEDEEPEERVIMDKLFRVKGRAGMIMMTQVPCRFDSLNPGDVFLMDTDEAIYQWNGESSNEDERAKAERFATNKAGERADLDGEPRMVIVLTQGVDDGVDWEELTRRKEAKKEMERETTKKKEKSGLMGRMKQNAINMLEGAIGIDIDGDGDVADKAPELEQLETTRPEFWDRLPKVIKGPLGDDIELEIQSAAGDDDDDIEVIPKMFKLKSQIYQFSTGPYDQIGDGTSKPYRSDLLTTEVYLIDTGFEYLVWIGNDANPDLCKLEHSFKIFPLALLYIKRYKVPAMLPLHMYKEGFEPEGFFGHFDHGEKILTRWEKLGLMLDRMFVKVFPHKKRDVVEVDLQADQSMLKRLGLSEASEYKARARSFLRATTKFWDPAAAAAAVSAAESSENYKPEEAGEMDHWRSRPKTRFADIDQKSSVDRV